MFASVDIGGTITSCAVASGAGQMVAERIIPTLSHEGPDAVLSRIAATINELAAGAGQRLLAFGAVLNSSAVILLIVMLSCMRTLPPCSGTVLT